MPKTHTSCGAGSRRQRGVEAAEAVAAAVAVGRAPRRRRCRRGDVRRCGAVGAVGVRAPSPPRDHSAALARRRGRREPLDGRVRAGLADRRDASSRRPRMPSMMRGSAAMVWSRLPPPSCSRMMPPGCRPCERVVDDGVDAGLLEVARVGASTRRWPGRGRRAAGDAGVGVAVGRAGADDVAGRRSPGAPRWCGRSRRRSCSSVSARQVRVAPGVVGDDVALGHDPADEVGVALGLPAELEERGLHAVAARGCRGSGA